MILDNILHFSHPLAKLEKQRLKLCQSKTLPDSLYPLLSTKIATIDSPLEQLHYLVIDFETTGLNSMIDNILSVAAVPIDHFQIKLSHAFHYYVAETQVKEDTAIINHIVPQMLDGARILDDVMHQLFKLMCGRVIIAHGAMIEKRFILHYLAARYNISSLPIIWLDTLKLERSFINKYRGSMNEDFQLSSVRKTYDLPDYITHNALIDSIATAELFLAQVNYLFGEDKKTLGEVCKRSSTAL